MEKYQMARQCGTYQSKQKEAAVTLQELQQGKGEKIQTKTCRMDLMDFLQYDLFQNETIK